MKFASRRMTSFLTGIVLLISCWQIPSLGYAGVCGDGTGMPPFLSGGAEPNLLMLLDNSGSMLDPAYVKKTTNAYDSYCFDDSYDSNITYAGYFEKDKWYVWQGGDKPWNAVGKDITADPWVAPWKNATDYVDGEIVYANGGLYRAENIGTSNDAISGNGFNIDDDGNITWTKVSQAPVVSSLPATCVDNTLVAYKNSVYICKSKWHRLEGGQFVQQQTALAAQTVCTDADGAKYKSNELCITVSSRADGGTEVQEAVNAFAARGNLLNWVTASKFDIQKKILTGGKYDPDNNQLVGENRGCAGYGYIKQVSLPDGASPMKLVMKVRGAGNDDRVGNLSAGASADHTTRIDIVGLSATGFVMSEACKGVIEDIGNDLYKQNSISDCIGRDKTDKLYKAQDAFSNTVNTCRQYLNGGNIDHYDLVKKKCEALYSDGYNPATSSAEDGGYICFGIYNINVPQKDREGYLGRCWDTGATALTQCGNLICETGETNENCYEDCPCNGDGTCDTGETTANCPADCPAAVCNNNGTCDTGETTANCPADCPAAVCNNNGTCDTGETTANCPADCPAKPVCTEKPGTSDCTPGVADGDSCWYCGSGGVKSGKEPNCAEQDIYLNKRNSDGTIWNYKCKGYGGNGGQGYTCTGGWEVQYVDGDGNMCIPSASIFDFSAPGYYYGMDRLLALAVIGVKPGESSGGWDTSTNPECAEEAMKDFCGSWKTPEVIDPSDQLGNTEQTYNLPAMLIDSNVIVQMGTEKPLAVMKGLIQYDPPAEQKTDDAAQPNGPRGIIYDVASDLRLGVMAFTENGAKTECDALKEACADSTSVYCSNRKAVVSYCPDNNSDGAKVLQPVKLGVSGDETTGLNWTHYKNIVTSINNTRATAWTPLAEAMHTALGYYTQNVKFCLNPPGTTVGENCESFPISTDDDPIDYWCQDNNILVITEGASTADLSGDVIKFATTPSSYFVGASEAGDITSGDQDGDLSDTCDAAGLDGSSYFDDMAWWGKHVLPLYKERKMLGANNVLKDKQDIATYVVTTGSLRNDGTTECSPAVLMRQAALNGSNGVRTEYAGEDPEKLESNLRAVFSDILNRSSAGSAASVISNSRSGSGAVYQAVFWPQSKDDAKNQVSWVGDVHALFMSSGGLMYEDTDLNGQLDPSEDLNNNGIITKADGMPDLDAYGKHEDVNGNDVLDGKDKRVLLYYSENVNRTRGCYNITEFIKSGGKCPGDATAKGDEDRVDEEKCLPGDHCVEIGDIAYLWSVNEKLRDRGIGQRPVRKLLTWNDADNDGKVDDDEFFDLNTMTAAGWTALNNIAVAATSAGRPRGKVTYDFLTPDDWDSFIVDDGAADVEETALTAMIDWLNGKDQYYDDGAPNADVNKNGRFDRKLRSRMYDFDGKGIDPLGRDVWRLGDVIHSTPLVVSKPAEVYQYIYRDASYADFYTKWSRRRNMIYFGGNDGMLHAVNGGFYVESTGQFCCALKADGTCESATAGTCSTGPDLGDEMWAYIPYNLQPHLKCLASEGYEHKYYVDQKPRIVDVQIFEEEAACSTDILSKDCIHAGGWGTILVGGMRFGGAPLEAEPLDTTDGITDPREFISSFFILDITNPEADPVLLGELTKTHDKDADGNEIYADLNYTTSLPTIVVMRDDTGGEHTEWYLVMGSGPTSVEGNNTEQGRLAVMPLEWLQGRINPNSWVEGVPASNSITGGDSDPTRRAFRIPNKFPETGTEGGIFSVPLDSLGGKESFVSDLVTIDFDVEIAAAGTKGALYRSDAVYFGTVDGTGFSYYPVGTDEDPKTYWNNGGRILRLVTRKSGVESGKVVEKTSKPSEWKTQWTDQQPIRMLLDAKAPVVSALSVGYDNKNFWIYGGTGRFYDKKDKTDDGMNEADTTVSPAENGKISYFGIKEPTANKVADLTFSGSEAADVQCKDAVLSWDTVNWDVNSQDNADLKPNNAPGKKGLMQVDNIIVSTFDSEYQVSFLKCIGSDCFPSDFPLVTVTNATGDEFTDVATFANLKKYIAGEGCTSEDATGLSTGLDGWYREFHAPRERNLGQAALLGGLLTFTSYQPFEDKCNAEGLSNLYGVHFQTGTAWTESVFGLFQAEQTMSDGTKKTRDFVLDTLSLGQGLSTTPSMHVGTGDQAASAFIQTSTGEIIEVKQENLPFGNQKSGRTNWSDQCTP